MINIEVKQGSAIEEDVDAVVNSANNWLILGSGIAGEIRENGGVRIQAECDRIIADNGGPVDIGSAVSTSAGLLSDKNTNLKYIIHAVGMGYKTKEDNGLQDRILATPETVFEAVKNALKVAEEMNIRTIAFPLMCSRQGYNTLDIKEGPSIMLKTMLRAINSYRTVSDSITKITICTGTLSISPDSV